MSETLNEAQAAQLPDVPFEVPEGFRIVSDEEAEALARQLVEDHREKWEIQEIVDSAVAAGEVSALLRNEFLYEYKQGNRQIRGLTAAMIIHLGTAQGVSEVVDQSVHTETDGEDGKHEFEVVVEMPDPRNAQRMIYRRGYAEEPKVAYGKYDKFAKAKAHTKAFRNATMKCLPQDLVIATIYKLAELVPADWTPPRQKALPPARNGQPALTERGKARAAAFAKYKARKADLEALGITEDVFKAGVYDHYDVKSSDEMTEDQCGDLEISLDVDGEFADWITALAPKKEGAAAEKPSSF